MFSNMAATLVPELPTAAAPAHTHLSWGSLLIHKDGHTLTHTQKFIF